MNRPIPKWLLPAVVLVVVVLAAVVGLLINLGVVGGPALIALAVLAAAAALIWHFAGHRRLIWAEVGCVLLLGVAVFLGRRALDLGSDLHDARERLTRASAPEPTATAAPTFDFVVYAPEKEPDDSSLLDPDSGSMVSKRERRLGDAVYQSTTLAALDRDSVKSRSDAHTGDDFCRSGTIR
jgi:hypothetical protein